MQGTDPRPSFYPPIRLSAYPPCSFHRLPHQGRHRLPQLVDPCSRPRARHDRLILVQLQGCAQLALAPQRECPLNLVTLGDRRKDARRPGGELILQVAILVGGVAPHVEEPEHSGEPRAVEGLRDESPEGGAIALARSGPAVAGEVEKVVPGVV